MALKVIFADGKTDQIEDPSAQVEVYRHSTSHLMAAAVNALFPGTHLGIGPAISEGFYYDFERAEGFTEENLPEIEQKMRELIAQNIKFEPSIISQQEAIDLFAAQGERLKVELIREKAGQTLSCYRLGDLVDFCTGPHVLSTAAIGPDTFRLLNIAGSYWKGDEHREQLQRIYGASFLTREDLEAYLTLIEEAKKRDHRKLGRELALFSISEEAGPGLIFWHPKGTRVRMAIEKFLTPELINRGYDFVTTPHVARNTLWKTSGHYDYYRENMYVFNIDDEEFVIKPMNCPGHIHIYQSKMRSYRDLPQRYAEYGTVYRYEKSGVLHGMLRVRGFTQDDAHIFCTPDQVYGEILALIDLVLFVM
jgi:threonyl-tRNA synthetase